MSVNIYPAHVVGKTVNHADNWNDDSTLNLANANFWSLVDEYKLNNIITQVPRHITLKSLERAMMMYQSSRYHERLKKLCAQAENPKTPLLERLRFVCIVSSNMDEFFEIRMSGLKEQLRDNPQNQTPDGLTVIKVS